MHTISVAGYASRVLVFSVADSPDPTGGPDEGRFFMQNAEVASLIGAFTQQASTCVEVHQKRRFLARSQICVRPSNLAAQPCSMQSSSAFVAVVIKARHWRLVVIV